MRLQLPRAEVLALAAALGSADHALDVIALRLAEDAGWLQQGTCADLSRAPWAQVAAASRELKRRSGATLQSTPLPAALRAEGKRLAAALLASEGADPLALSGAAELLCAAQLAKGPRRALGAFYTPPELAALVVDLALQQGNVGKDQLPSVIDPCVGAGAFVAAAARALRSRQGRRAAALACGGADLSAAACAAARAALALEAGPEASSDDLRKLAVRVANSLFAAPRALADLLVSNPPYGHLDDAAERARIAERHPALRGGELDRYAAFLLRAFELVRPGGTIALLVPDSWMTNSRSGALRAAVLAAGELAAVVDLGKPFAAAKDTRVQAVVLVRRQPGANINERSFINAGRRAAGTVVALAPLDPRALSTSAKAGWQPYRSEGERDLCAAMEAASVPLGSVCEVGYGLRTGDNGRHVVRGPAQEGCVPLLGGEDIVPFGLRYKPKHLPPASAQELVGLVRRQLGRPRVAIQRIRTNSSASHARWLEAALCPAERVCLDSISTLFWDGEERLWALLGLICSTAMNRYHRLRTTDVNVKPALLGTLPLPRRLLEEKGAKRLAELARARAEEVAAGNSQIEEQAPAIERAIDQEVYELFELSNKLIDVSEHAHWSDRYEIERPRLTTSGALAGSGTRGRPGPLYKAEAAGRSAPK